MPDLSIEAEQHGDIAAENRLQELGYEQELVRGMGFLGIFGMGLCILCLPVTVYAISVTMMVLGGPVSFLWGWLVWGIISIIIACCMGELVSVYPVASGTYFWSYAMTSPKARNVSSYVNGWFLCIGLVLATLAAVFPFAQGIATSIVLFHPDFVPSNGLNYGIFVALLAVTLALACCGTSFLNLFNKYSAYWTMLVTVVLFITPLVECQNRNDIKWVLSHFDQSYSGWGGWAWFCSLLGPAGVLCGFGFMTGMCEECHEPEKNVPKAMVYTQIASVVVGIPFIISTLFIMPDLDVVVGAINGQAAYVILESAMTHPGGAFALLILAYTCAIGLCVESLTATSRFIWGFARDGGLPFSGWLSKVHPKLQVPLNAMIAVCVINLLLALISFGSTTAYAAFLGSCTVLVLSAYVHPLLLNIIARGAYTKNAPWSLGRLSLPFNIVSVLSVFVGVIAFCFPSYVIFDATTMNYCIVMVAGFMAISLAYYLIHGRKVFTGPKLGDDQVFAVEVLDRVQDSEAPSSKPTEYKESNVGVDVIEA